MQNHFMNNIYLSKPLFKFKRKDLTHKTELSSNL